jgi:hypothetical protein
MSIANLHASIPGVTGIKSIDLIEGYKTFARTCTIQCLSTTLSLGDEITVDMGYDDDFGRVFTGVVKKFNKASPDNTLSITCYDRLIRASDYFLVSEDPENPFTRTNIDAADLVEDLLEEAGLTGISIAATNFIFTEPSFNLVSVSDAIGQISGILAYQIWCDEDGDIHFEDRRPYIMAGDTSSYTFVTGSAGTILTNEYTRSDDDLRNKVVVYGKDNLVATASAVSPYLPVGYYKTAVIASPLISDLAMAQASADYNLELYNRLTRQVACQAIGDYRLHVNEVVTVTEAHTGVSGDWFIYSISHSWSEDGYTVRMVLTA